MKKIVYYEVEEKVANSVRTILASISDKDMQEKYKLTSEGVLDIHTYLDNVELVEDKSEWLWK